MPEKSIKELLTERSPRQCTCTPLKVANFAIACAAEKAGVGFDEAAELHEQLLDRECPGMIEIEDACSRDGCLPDHECGHKNGSTYLHDATRSIEF